MFPIIVSFLVLCAIAYGVYALINNEKYRLSTQWFKTPIAFVVGFMSAVLSTPFLRILHQVSVGMVVGSGGVIGILTELVGMVLGVISSIPIGIFVYYKLCNATQTGVNIGRVLYALLSLICIYNTYYHFVYAGDVLTGGLWIASIAAGLATLVNIDKLVDM